MATCTCSLLPPPPPNSTHNDMPVVLIVFGDKSHMDLHGAFVLTPIIFILPLFNRTSQNNANFWRPLAYLNLGYGMNKADKTATKDKVQNKHECLSVAFESIRRIHRVGGFRTSVFGREVNIKIWGHYFIGDTEGINGWVTIRELKAKFIGLTEIVSVTLMKCPIQTQPVSITLSDMLDAKILKRNDENQGLLKMKEMSRYDIKNALTKKYMPLSDNIHGPYCMMPPEWCKPGWPKNS